VSDESDGSPAAVTALCSAVLWLVLLLLNAWVLQAQQM
jgi:hypothetical protein